MLLDVLLQEATEHDTQRGSVRNETHSGGHLPL